jgi:putative nucleotidyltransferase with HDIG domain
MSRRLRLEGFRTAVVLTAAGIALLRLRGLERPVDATIPLLLFALGVLAIQFPLRVSLINKLSVADAVFFTEALVLSPMQAATLAAITQAASSAVSIGRKWRADRKAPPFGVALPTVVFNVSQLFVAEWCSGHVLGLDRVSARSDIGSPAAALTIVAAASCFYLVNNLSVSTAIGLASGRNPLQVFVAAQRIASLQLAGLYLIAVVAALTIVRYPWAPILLTLPAGLIYISLKRTLQLSTETLLAVQKMAEMVDLRDPYTAGHSRRVAAYCVELGRALRLSVDDVESLRLAALVHDLGKIGVPDAILRKPGRLTAEEKAVMDGHPQAGYEILAQFSEYAKVRELVLTHHERYDGQGYPNRVLGHALPLLAQVMPVADTIDAMTSARPYRGALPMEAALAELQRGAGSQWHPAVVAAAQGLYGKQAPRPAGRPAVQPA